MQLFEFLMVLVSIVVGLGIAALLTGIANILRSRHTVSFYPIHAILVAAIFLAHAQVWWESWSLQETVVWNFAGLMMMLGSPVMLFLIAHLLFPRQTDGSDLEKYYFEVAPVIWLLAAGAVTIGTLFRPVIIGEQLFTLDNLSSLPTLLICIVLASTQKRAVHSVLVPALMLMILLDIVLINWMLGSE